MHFQVYFILSLTNLMVAEIFDWLEELGVSTSVLVIVAPSWQRYFNCKYMLMT